MTPITVDLARILQAVRRPGDFHATGRSEIFAPQIEVAGVGPISLPLVPAQAEQLATVAEQAPYGRGSDTLIDTEVRRTWQIGPDQMRIGGRHWHQSLSAIVARCTAGLGVSEPVSAELYKMLVYDTGSFFLSHRDTEKTPGMFATLVIVLPSIYTGGELLIRHRGREVCLDLACEESAEVGFAAFYADCQHEVLPVTSGCRLVLIYNLVRQGPGLPPEAPAYDGEQQRIGDLLRRWAKAVNTAAPETDPSGYPLDKLVYPLEHAYTPAEIGFARLKNADAAMATVLAAAARSAACELYLALLTIEESGSAEFAYPSQSSRYSRYAHFQGADEDNFEVGEVFERSLTLSDWQAPDASRPPLASLSFKDDELSPPDALQDEEPDEQTFLEATGNEGASFERSYRRAAFVLWPQAGRLQVIVGGGLDVSLPYLADLAQRWAAGAEETGSALWNEARQLATLLMASGEGWRMRRWPHRDGPTRITSMLASLSQLHDSKGIASFLASVTANGHYRSDDNEAIAEACGLLPPGQVAELLEAILAGNTAYHAEACAELLERVSIRLCAAESSADSSPDAAVREAGVLLEPAAAALLAALPGDPALAAKPEAWPRPEPVTPALVAKLLAALCRLGMLAMGERAVDHLLAWPQTFAVDATLLPAALQLNQEAAADWPPARRLKAACLTHLEKRIAEPLAAPADFARASHIACRCQHCAELSAFLADPLRQLWLFKAAQTYRSHVEDSIRNHRCDVDCETRRQGSPHGLLCTKNQASYELRRTQRQHDLEAQARLSSAPPGG